MATLNFTKTEGIWTSSTLSPTGDFILEMTFEDTNLAHVHIEMSLSGNNWYNVSTNLVAGYFVRNITNVIEGVKIRVRSIKEPTASYGD